MAKKIYLQLLLFLLFLVTAPTAFATYHTSNIIPSTYQNYGLPRGILALPNGDLWYADSQNARIVKIDPQGNILRTIGGAGDKEGQFAFQPGTTLPDGAKVSAITADNAGNLYVLNSGHVTKFDFNGGFIKKWGSYGNGTTDFEGDPHSQLNESKGITYSAFSNEILVSDWGNSRVVRFDTEGNYLGEFGTTGSDDGQFSEPQGITTDRLGNIYIADTANQRIQIFEPDGTFVRKFGSNLLDPSDHYFLSYPKDVAVLSNGNIVVTSQSSQQIKIFDNNGNWISQWGEDGNGDSQFKGPEYLTKTSDDTIWITDGNLRRLQHFNIDGSLIGIIENNGYANGKFTNPISLDFDEKGNIFVLDNMDNSDTRVEEFDSIGNYISTPIQPGVIGFGAWHMVIDPNTQNIIVSSQYSVTVFDRNGNFLNMLGAQGIGGSGDGQFSSARALAFDSTGLLYVVDYDNARVEVFDLSHISDPDFVDAYSGGYVRQWNTMQNPEFMFIDSENNVYISPPEAIANPSFDPEQGEGVENWQWNLQVMKYDTFGGNESVFVDEYSHGREGNYYYGSICGIFIDGNGKLYLTDRNNNHIFVSGGELIERVGSDGSGLDEFSNPNYGKINPVTNDLVVADSYNHRVQLLTNGVKIQNLVTSADVIDTSNSSSLVKKTIDPNSTPNADNLQAKMYFGSYLVSDFKVNLTTDRDWALVNAISLPNQSKSLVVNLNPTDAPGISSTHSLYITKQQGQTYVRICPKATQISDLTLDCIDGYNLQEGDTDLSVVNINSQEYWKIDGLTGTGGLSPIVNSFYTSTSQTNVSVGESVTVTITATNDVGLTDSSYSGTIHLSTNPGTSTLPTDYTYTPENTGVHSFESIKFNAPGIYTLTFVDTLDASRNQSIVFHVTSTGDNSDNNPNNNSGVSTSGFSENSNGAPSCNSSKPSFAPNLFQINTNDHSAKIFFSPLPDTNAYFISFSELS